MTALAPTSRFTAETGHFILVETPENRADALLKAALEHDPLAWGDYDSVAFRSEVGIQQFRALGTGRNAATPGIVTVPCLTLRFFTALCGAPLTALIEALYHTHPYEEPVIALLPATRTRHIRGQDEDNPNRFWNGPAESWVPANHR